MNQGNPISRQASQPGMIINANGKEYISVGQVMWRGGESGERIVVVDLVMDSTAQKDPVEVRPVMAIVRAVEAPKMDPKPLARIPDSAANRATRRKTARRK